MRLPQTFHDSLLHLFFQLHHHSGTEGPFVMRTRSCNSSSTGGMPTGYSERDVCGRFNNFIESATLTHITDRCKGGMRGQVIAGVRVRVRVRVREGVRVGLGAGSKSRSRSMKWSMKWSGSGNGNGNGN